jgi:hypothetical protein
MVFDIKFDFTRKTHFVAGGHVTDPPSNITYSSIVGCNSVQLAFLIAALNDLEILSADVRNAYLNALTKQRVQTICRPEFRPSLAGRIAVITRALYGLESSGAAWRDLLAGTLRDMGFLSTLVDPDAWIHEAVKANGTPYYKYLFVYVDDLLVLLEKPNLILDVISKA